MSVLGRSALCLAFCVAALPTAANYYDATNAAFANVQADDLETDNYYGWQGGWPVSVPTAAIRSGEDVGTGQGAHFKFTGLIPDFPHKIYTYAMYVKDLNYSYTSLAVANSDLAVYWPDNGSGTPFGYQSWHEFAEVTPSTSGVVNLYLGNRPTPGGSGGLARFELVPVHTSWDAVFQVEDVVVNPEVLGVFPDSTNNQYEVNTDGWGGYTWLAMHDSETIAPSNVPHLQLTGLQPNHWYAMRFHEAWLGSARYSFASAALANSDWTAINRLNSGNFDTLQNMSSAQADGSGVIDIYLGDFISSVPDNFAGWDYIEVWDATVSILSANTVQVDDAIAASFTSEAGESYRLEYATDPVNPVWTGTDYILAGTGADLTAYDPDGASASRIYRVVKQ